MFLLTEGTLLFLDLALNARTCDEKPSLSSVVQKWLDGVATANDNSSADGSQTTPRASSTSVPQAPVYLSTAVGQALPVSGCSGVATENVPQSTPVFSKASFLEDDEAVEETATSYCSETSLYTSRMVSSTVTSGSGSDRCDPDLNSRFCQRQQNASRGVKRKIDDVDIVSNIGSKCDGDDCMDLPESTSGDGCQVPKTLSVDPTSSVQKKFKYEDMSVHSRSPPLQPTLGCAAFIAQLHALRKPRVNNDCHLIKRRSEYTTRDLPVPCDQRWSQSFISTAILWYSVQNNIWNVPEEELSSALQCIFSAVYPNIKYRVTPAGSVFALTLQRIHAWRSGFASSALAMILHFFSSFDDDDEVHAAAEFLATDSRFLREDPDSSEPTELFRSPLLLTLLAITHLSDIAAFVDVPGWDTHAMVAGEGGEGVIGIASTALEHALALFRDGTLVVDRVFTETALSPDIPSPALQFSSANWSSHTTMYQNAVRTRGTTFVRGTFAAAQAKRQRIAVEKDSESEASACMSISTVPDPRALP